MKRERILTDEERQFFIRIMSQPLSISPSFIKELRKEKERLQFEKKLDLHGYTIQDAWDATNLFLDEAKRLSIFQVVVVTGKSGEINKEFQSWLSYRTDVVKVDPHSSGGSFNIFLQKKS